MRVAMLQAESAVLDIDANIAAINQAAARAQQAGAAILLTPELFPVGYAPRLVRDRLDPGLLAGIADAVGAIAREHGIALVYSLPEVNGGQWRITATFAGPDGATVANYGKVHLFGDEEREAFSPAGDPPAVVDFGGLRLAVAVCYDIEFPETARAAALQGAQVLLVPTALSVGYQVVPERLIPTRALESQLYVAYANHCGNEDGLAFSGGSVVADPFGTLVARAGAAEELVIADFDPAVVEKARREVPYLKDRRPGLYQGWGL